MWLYNIRKAFLKGKILAANNLRECKILKGILMVHTKQVIITNEWSIIPRVPYV